jgi:ABC-2 type transport system ATP-binding protein
MTTTPPPAVQVHDLHRRYGADSGFEAVRGVSFEVGRGELFALLGTNGAGKTSTLEVVEGLAAPTSGRVRVLGHDPRRERSSVRPRTGVVLQQGGLPGDLTAVEAARTWAGTLTRPAPAALVLEQVGLGHRAAVRIAQLSGGERRRLDLALALLSRPEVLFLDEPTTGLDPESRRTTWRLVRDLVDAGTTVLVTTHYLEEAQEHADRVAVMHAGEVVVAGTPGEVVAGFPAEVRWEREPGTALPRLPGASTALEGTRVVVRTTALQPVLTALMAWAATTGTSLRGLTATSASLEAAFLAVADGDRPTIPSTPSVPTASEALR